MNKYYCFRVFFKEIETELSEFIFKKKFLPKDDPFWLNTTIPSLSDFMKFLKEDKFKSDSDFTQKVVDLLEAFIKIEKKNLGISIQA